MLNRTRTSVSSSVSNENAKKLKCYKRLKIFLLSIFNIHSASLFLCCCFCFISFQVCVFVYTVYSNAFCSKASNCYLREQKIMVNRTAERIQIQVNLLHINLSFMVANHCLYLHAFDL